jgi:PAS domain S-box-containing protein
MSQDRAFNEEQVARAVLHGAADAIVACDRDGIIRFWNQGAARIFGFDGSEALGQSLDIIIPERLRARHWDGYRAMMSSGQSRYSGGDTLAVPGQRKDGARISVEFTIVALHDAQGGISGLAAVMRDVTARFDELKALRQQVRGKAAAGTRATGE